MIMIKQSVSKTRYMEGIRCPKLFWLRCNRPDLAEPLDPQTVYLFQTGHRIEEYARQLFPGGVLIGNGHSGSFSDLLAETEQVTKHTDVPYLYEASFSSRNMLCRTDLLQRSGKNGKKWILGELKMSTKLKPEFILDVAFQHSCMENAGYKIEKSYLLHINREYVRQGEIEPEKLLLVEEITQKAATESEKVPGKVRRLLDLAQRPDPPEVIIGGKCHDPGRCPFYQHCHKNIPSGSVFELPYGHKLIPGLISRGVTRLADIPPDVPLSQRQAALVRSACIERPVIEKNAIAGFLDQIRFPIFFLDLETINSCIPPYESSSPYERIPFQFSVHVQRSKNGELEHFEFLPFDALDPRNIECSQLIDIIGDNGTILAWNMPFEKSVLSSLESRFPQYAEKIQKLLPRFIDLIWPFKSGAYSDWRTQGSASLKKVLPVLVPSLSYKNLAIQKGDDASLRFQRFIDGDMSKEEWAAQRDDMLAYNLLDTLAMVRILEFLQAVV
jgi:hypothetical protein